jgi:23S rRNA pseudouridine2604 synthase
MRLNKFIADTGICSRREADRWIAEGRVTVNGQAATLGTQVGEGDAVAVAGRPVGAAKRHVYLALNKPVGITCTTERDIEGNIVDFVGYPERIFPVGRLDKDSEGLILLTNDGDIVNEVLRAENAHEKEYLVTLDRPITELFLKCMAEGVRIMGITTRPCRVERLGRERFRIVLTQGLNRQIRRMCSAMGYQVRRLQRIRVINITLDGLAPGAWRQLRPDEVDALLRQTPARADAR